MLRRNVRASRVLSTKNKIVASERDEQMALVRWLDYHPILKNHYCKMHNEGKRSPLEGRNLKLLGLRPGVSDLFIFYPFQGLHGLWLEMKQNRNYTPSEKRTRTWVAQENFVETVKKLGFSAHFCYGCEDAIKIINAYLLQ
jgi:hypothetical protein